MAGSLQHSKPAGACAIQWHGLTVPTAVHPAAYKCCVATAPAAVWHGARRFTAARTAVHATSVAAGKAPDEPPLVGSSVQQNSFTQAQQHSLSSLVQQLCRVGPKHLPNALRQMEHLLLEAQHAQHTREEAQPQEQAGQLVLEQVTQSEAQGVQQAAEQKLWHVQQQHNRVDVEQWVLLLEKVSAAGAIPGPRLLQALYSSTHARFLRSASPTTTASLLLYVLQLTGESSKPRHASQHTMQAHRSGVAVSGPEGRGSDQEANSPTIDSIKQQHATSQVTRSWISSTLELLKPHLGSANKLPPSLLVQLLRALASHSQASAPSHRFMRALYAKMVRNSRQPCDRLYTPQQVAAQQANQEGGLSMQSKGTGATGAHASGLHYDVRMVAAPTEGDSTDGRHAAVLAGAASTEAYTAGGESVVTQTVTASAEANVMRAGLEGSKTEAVLKSPLLPTSMSLAHVQQCMWAISRLVTVKGAAGPVAELTQVVQQYATQCLAADQSGSNIDNIRAAASICISIAHLQAPADKQLLQLVETTSLGHLPVLQPSMVAELIWAFACLNWQPSSDWLSLAVHRIHGAASIAPDKLVQALWAVSILLAPLPSPSFSALQEQGKIVPSPTTSAVKVSSNASNYVESARSQNGTTQVEVSLEAPHGVSHRAEAAQAEVTSEEPDGVVHSAEGRGINAGKVATSAQPHMPSRRVPGQHSIGAVGGQQELWIGDEDGDGDQNGSSVDVALLQRLLPQLLARLQPQLPKLSGASLGTTLWALARLLPAATCAPPAQHLQHTSNRLQHPLVAQQVAFFEALLLACATRMHTASAHMVITMVWSVRRLGFTLSLGETAGLSQAAAAPVMSTTTRNPASTQPLYVRQGSNRQFRSRLLLRFVQAATQHALSGLPRVSATDHVALMISLAAMGWRPSPAWMEPVLLCISPSIHTLPLASFSKLLQSCSRLLVRSTAQLQAAGRSPGQQPQSNSRGRILGKGATTGSQQKAAPTSVSSMAEASSSFLVVATTTCVHHLGLAVVNGHLFHSQQELPEHGRHAAFGGILSLAQTAEGMGTLCAQLHHLMHLQAIAAESKDSMTVSSADQQGDEETGRLADVHSGQEAAHTPGHGQGHIHLVEQLSGHLARNLAASWRAGSTERVSQTGTLGQQLVLDVELGCSPSVVAHALCAVCWLRHGRSLLMQQQQQQRLSHTPSQAAPITKPPLVHISPPHKAGLMPRPHHSTDAPARRVEESMHHSRQSGPEDLLYSCYGLPLLPPSAVVVTTAVVSSGADEESGGSAWQTLRTALQQEPLHLLHASFTAGLADHGLGVATCLLQAHVVLSVCPRPELYDMLLQQIQAEAAPWQQAIMKDTVAAGAMLHALQEHKKLFHTAPADAAGVTALKLLIEQLQRSLASTPAQAISAGDLQLLWVTTSRQLSELVNVLAGQGHGVGCRAPGIHTPDSAPSPFHYSTMPPMPSFTPAKHAVSPPHLQAQQVTVAEADKQQMEGAVCTRFRQLLPSMGFVEVVDVLHGMAQAGWTLDPDVHLVATDTMSRLPQEAWLGVNLNTLCKLHWAVTMLQLNLPANCKQLLDERLEALLEQEAVASVQLHRGAKQVTASSPSEGSDHASKQEQQQGQLVCLLWSAARQSLQETTTVVSNSLRLGEQQDGNHISIISSQRDQRWGQEVVQGQGQAQGSDQVPAGEVVHVELKQGRKQQAVQRARGKGGAQAPVWCGKAAVLLSSTALQLSLDQLCTVMWACNTLQRQCEQQQLKVARHRKGGVAAAHGPSAQQAALSELEALFMVCQHLLFKQLTAVVALTPTVVRRSRSRSPTPGAMSVTNNTVEVSPSALAVSSIGSTTLEPVQSSIEAPTSSHPSEPAASADAPVSSSLSVSVTSLLAVITAVASKRARAHMQQPEGTPCGKRPQSTTDSAVYDSSSSSSTMHPHCPFPYVLLVALAAGMPSASPHMLLSSLHTLLVWRISPGKALETAIRAKVQSILEHVVARQGLVVPGTEAGSTVRGRSHANQRRSASPETRASNSNSKPPAGPRVWKLSDNNELTASQLVAICHTWSRMDVEIPRSIARLMLRALLHVLPSCSHKEAVQAVRVLVRVDAVVRGQAAALLMNGIAHHLQPPDVVWYDALAALQSPQLSGRGLVSLLSAMAQLSSGQDWQPATPLLQDCCNALVKAMPTIGTAQVAHALWAFAKLEHRPHRQCMAAFIAHVEQHMQRCGLKRLATVLYSLAALGYQPPQQWLQGFYTATTARCKQAIGPQSVSVRARSNIRAWQGHQHSASSRAGRAHGSAESHAASSAARLLWAAATLQLNPPPSWTALLAQLVGIHMQQCSTHDLTLTAIGCTVLGPRLDDRWLAAYQAAVQAHAVGGDTHSKMQLMWAWQRLRGRVALDRREEAAVNRARAGGSETNKLKLKLRIKQPLRRLHVRVQQQHGRSSHHTPQKREV